MNPIILYRREKALAAKRKKRRGPTEMDRLNAKWFALAKEGKLWDSDPRRMRPSARRKK